MAKFTNYVIIMSGFVLLFYVMGLLGDTPNSTLLNLLLDPSSMQNSSLSILAFAAIEAILATAVVVGFAVAGNIELGVMVAFSIALFNMLWDFISVINLLSAYIGPISLLVFSPLLLLFMVTMLEWWRGVTT